MTLALRARSPILPNLQLVWTSTALGAFKKCPRYYQLSILQGYLSHGANIDINFGLAYHEGKRRFQDRLALGDSHDIALREAVRHTMVYSKDMLLANPSEAAANKSRPNLIRSLVWHCEHYFADFAKGLIFDGKAATELSFHVPLGIPASTGEEFTLAGHLDWLVEFQGKTYILDYKTTKTTLGERYYQGFDPDNQISIYTLGGKIAYGEEIKGVIIDAAQIAVGHTAFGRAPITRTKGQLDEWLGEQSFWLAQADVCAQREAWPMNDKSCFGCEFRGICSKDPAVRDSFLKTFSQRDYDPLEVR